MSKAKARSAARSKLVWSDLSWEEQREYLERFATELKQFLQSKDGERPGRKTIMDKLNVDVRQFDSFLQHLYEGGYLQLGCQLIPERAHALKGKPGFDQLEKITVVAGSNRDRFAQAAAKDFIKRLVQIGRVKRTSASNHPVNVGIVSGNTTGSVIGAAMRMDWARDLQEVDLTSLPKFRVFALNVCLTVPEHLPGNATILAYQLAEKIRAEQGEADGYGLSATLMVKKEGLKEADEAPQTFDVLKFTEPARVQEKLAEQGANVDKLEAYSTDLDIVLTGVGELPRHGTKDDQRGSIFYNLAKQHGFDMETLIDRERIVGDIAFTAIRSDGTPVTLRKQDRAQENAEAEGGEGTEFVFYSAVQGQILEAMANDRNKSVILVARHDEEKDKVPAIFASISGGRHRYVSRLVIDEETANKLCRY